MRDLYRLLPNPACAKNYFVEVAKTGDELALRVAVDDLITALCIKHESRRGSTATFVDWSQCSAVELQRGKASGACVFKGTRVPVRALFESRASVTGDVVKSGCERLLPSAPSQLLHQNGWVASAMQSAR
jgi:hypothetical protein